MRILFPLYSVCPDKLQTFLSSLEERQKECRLFVDNFGDLLQSNMENMGVYAEYCINQGTAIRVLQSLRQSNPELAACLQVRCLICVMNVPKYLQCLTQHLRDEPSVRNLDLSSYLLVPSRWWDLNNSSLADLCSSATHNSIPITDQAGKRETPYTMTILSPATHRFFTTLRRPKNEHRLKQLLAWRRKFCITSMSRSGS